MQRILLFLVLLFLGQTVSAQDYQFSQFFASPLTLNPALTGLFPGRYRVAINHRSQWGQSLETPFSTSAFAADFHYYVNPNKRRYSDAFGVGVLFVSDRVTEINFNTNQMMLGGAYHKSLDAKNESILSLGVQVGVVQRNISYDQLTFEDEFDGTTGYAGGTTGEELPANNFAFGDYQLGLSYSYSPRRSTAIFLGVALHHVGEPEQSFFEEITQGEEIEVSNLLHRRYSAYFNLRIPAGRNLEISPRIYYRQQGPHATANAGTNLRFLINDTNGTAFHLGAWARPARSQETYTLDSATGLVGLEISNFLLGLSYDVGLNSQQVNRRHQGAFELSISYLGQSEEDEAVPCPKF